MTSTDLQSRGTNTWYRPLNDIDEAYTGNKRPVGETALPEA